MKIVFVAPYLPVPARHGGQRRTLQLLSTLRRFADVELLAIAGPEERERAAAELAALDVPTRTFAPVGPDPACRTRSWLASRTRSATSAAPRSPARSTSICVTRRGASSTSRSWRWRSTWARGPTPP